MCFVISNAEWIDSEGSVKSGDILIKEGKIEEIFPSGSFSGAETQKVDARGQLIIPGMTNTHYHSYSNLLKGTETDLPLELWSLYTVAYGHSLTDEDIYLAVLLGAAEMIRSGVTSCLDHFPHISRAESALEAYLDSGMHVSFAPMIHDVPDHQFLQLDLPDDIRRSMESVASRSSAEMNDFYRGLIGKWHGKDGRIQLTVGPNAPQRCSTEALELCNHLSKTYDLPIHTHLLETEIQREYGRLHYGGGGVITHLDQAGILDNRLTVAHAIWLDDWEMDFLKERGVSIVHNPASNMILGSGKAPIFDYLQKGFSVGLGTDASNCGTTHSLFETMKLAAMMPRVGERDPGRWPQASHAFEMATVHGARVIGNENRKGKIQEGFDADLVFLNKNTPTWSNTHDAISQLVFHENGTSVDSVMIRGEWVLKNKEISIFDECRVIERVQERAETLRENSEEAVELADRISVHMEKFYHYFYNGRNEI